MSKARVTLFLFVIFGIGTANVIIMTVKNIDSTLTISNKLWNNFNNRKMVKLNDLKKSFTKIQKSLRNVEINIGNVDKDTSKLLSAMKNNTHIKTKLQQLKGYTVEINSAFNSFHKYLIENEKYSNTLLKQLAMWSVSQSPSSVSGILKKINNITKPDPIQDFMPNDFMETMLELIETPNSYMCTMQQSLSQLFFNIYSALMLIEMKGYTIMQFSWMILEIFHKNSNQEVAKLERSRFQQRIKHIIQASKITMAGANRDLWRCDPKQHLEGKTYLSLTKLLQGYIENEIGMNSQQMCKYNCKDYQNATAHGYFKAPFSSQQPICKGKILGCQHIASDMTVCQSSIKSNRRYEWIEYKNGIRLGEKNNCNIKLTTVNSWWSFKHTNLGHCTYCMCICDDPSTSSDRHFSLNSELSNVKKNRIIVGIRFVKLKQVIHIQICEGTLLAGGKINKKSIAWKKIIPMNLKYAEKYLDYYQMSYKERTIDLHDLEGPSGYVLTGVRFVISESHLNLKIQTMPFDIKTGKLQTNKYKWISNNNNPNTEMNPREELKLTEPDVPTKFSKQSLPDSIDNQYMLFTHTDFEKDVAQTTVPYLDAQPVIPKIPVPLSGIGIFHKGFQGSGGFIALKIFTYNYEHHL